MKQNKFSTDAYGRIKHDEGFYYYTQGGLDSHCSIYSVVNAINYLEFKHNPKIIDKISQNDWELFIAIRNYVSSKYFLNSNGPKKCVFFVDSSDKHREFGAEGAYGSRLQIVANKFLNLIDYNRDFKEDCDQEDYILRDEEKFSVWLQKHVCLVWIEENDDRATLGHWIATTPSGLVIDSLRGITSWQLYELKGKRIFQIKREDVKSCGNPEFESGVTSVKHVHCVIPVALKED